MRCDELREWLSADLDGEARAGERAAVRAHLAVCAECRRARAAAEGLRGELDLAARGWATEDRDEALLAVLRSEGFCGAAIGVEPQRHRGHRGGMPGWAGGSTAAAGGWRQVVRTRCSPGLCGCTFLQSVRSFRPAIAIMGVAFLVTWGSLRWAESGRAGAVEVPSSLPATARVGPPDAEMLDQWMAGTPTLAALERLQRLPAPAPAAPPPIRRGAALQERPREG